MTHTQARTISVCIVSAVSAFVVGGIVVASILVGAQPAPGLPDTSTIEAACAARGLAVVNSNDAVEGGTDGLHIIAEYQSLTVCEAPDGRGVAVQIMVLTREPITFDEADIGAPDIDPELVAHRIKTTM